MHQKREKGDRMNQSNQDAILKLLSLLEGSDSDNVDYVKSMIDENLSECKDSRLINGIIDYCMIVDSHKPLDAFIRLKEPHEKHLFDKLTDLIKNEKTRYKALQILSTLVYKQPPWLYKISNQRIMNTILCMLKHDLTAPNLMTGIFIINCLIPLIPSQFGPYLADAFAIFSRLAAWNVKKPSTIVDVYMPHLQVVVYSLFHRLYGMFPCNFLAYLRSHYGARDSKERSEELHRIFQVVIRPMLERVRLHPLLVTASKDTELSVSRWKKMAYHDIIVDCASVSLDAVEGSYDVRHLKTSQSSCEENARSYDQFMSISSQSSASITYESECAVNEALTSTLEIMWSPSNAVAISTPPSHVTPTLDEHKHYSTQLSSEETAPVDIAIEAKPDVLKVDTDFSENVHNRARISKSPVAGCVDVEKHSIEACTTVKSCDSASSSLEAKEDEADQEVSELTSSTKVGMRIGEEIRHDTPFCSTTQNLTDNFTKNTENSEELFNSLQENDMVSFESSPYARFRYLSQCGPPPDIAVFTKPKVSRSVSCPAVLIGPPDSHGNPSSCLEPIDQAITTCSSLATETVTAITTASCVFVPVTTAPHTTMVLAPPNVRPSAMVSNICGSTTLSPPELLDRYIQLGHLATQSPQLSSISMPSCKDTDWTHFGGQPPADEITIVRNQVLLLHNQLLFERHRKDVHSERNRRILGRAKKYRIQEEHIIALKEQVKLLEQDNVNLRDELEKKMKLHMQHQAEKEQNEKDLHNKISKADQENASLFSAQGNLQSLLVLQGQENKKIIEEKDQYQSEIQVLCQDVEKAKKDATRVQILEKDCLYLSKQMILQQELLDNYKDREEHDRNQQHDIGEQLMNNAAVQELNVFKQKFEEKSLLLNVAERKVSDYEKILTEGKSKRKEHFQDLEHIKALYNEEIKVLQERLKDLRKITVQKDFCILNLHKDIETLENEKKALEKSKNDKETSSEECSSKMTLEKTHCDKESSNTDFKPVLSQQSSDEIS